MGIIIAANGSTGKRRAEVSKYTMRKATDMKDSGKEIYPMAKAKFLTGMAPIILANSKTTSNTEKDNFTIFRTKGLLTKFTKMAF